ncbi:hypothetical protein L226DRAFT_508609 [Lentinus tigrinus ALCF2SS1-7]|uniref:uncharacterized protein n=1 Tax=Lentinus tigrinus ALCF2SS1-7 TaxID=1328758 RepID=UPI001165EE28|nr:hypothetical protein L226DRAFT_508609 [Lentinus tigrinus ALCF2SS1-7]
MSRSVLGDAHSYRPEGIPGHSPLDWSSYAQIIKHYDEDMVRGWKEEIDTLLVFAGLFSAVVTAFNIEAYKLLQPDPAQITVQLLQDISQQLALARGENASSIPADLAGRLPTSPVVQCIRFNILWFSSLVCALFAALLGMMVKQWLREYMAAILFSSRHSVRLRQHRYEGLIAWHVPKILAFLPILLEVSLILFFAGLVDFLWLLQSTVATVVTCLVAMALLFYTMTTVVPVFSSHCPFKSPQAWLFAWIFTRCRTRITTWKRRLDTSLPRFQPHHDSNNSHNSPPTHHFADWRERDNKTVWDHRHDLDLKAVTWIQASLVDEEVQDSLISIVPDLRTDHAMQLVFAAIAREGKMAPPLLINRVRERACAEVLRTVGARSSRTAKARIFRMLLALLEHIPNDYDASAAGLGALDVLWTLWEICMACLAEDLDLDLHISIFNGTAKLLHEDQPFRVRRAALNILYETTHTWSYLFCPATIGDIISFARSCYGHHLFVKAAAVALLLSPGLDWSDNDTTPNHRQQLKELLRDLSRFLKRCNEDGIKHEEHSAGKLIYGLVLLTERNAELVEAMLPDVLLKSVDLGLLDLSQDEHLKLRGMQHTHIVPTSSQPNGSALPTSVNLATESCAVVLSPSI